MREKLSKPYSVPWWQLVGELPAFPPPPWELTRDDEAGVTQWIITSELRAGNGPPVAIVPTPFDEREFDDEQKAAAYLIAAAPALFMGAAALARLLELTPDPQLRRPLEFLRQALDLARGRG